MLIYSFITDYQVFNLRYKDNTTRDKNETKVGKQSANLGKNNEPIQNRLSFLIDCKSVILHHLAILSFPMVRPAWDNWWLYKISVSGFALNYATPGGLMGGEPYRIMALTPLIGRERASSSVILFVMTHIFSHFWFWLLSIVLFVTFYPINALAASVVAAASLFCLLGLWFFVVGYKKGVAMRLARWLSKVPWLGRFASRLMEKHGEEISNIDRQIAALHKQNRKTLVAAVMIELMCRVLSAAEIYFVFMAIGYPVSYMSCVLILAFTSLFANLLFFMPLQLGGREGGFLMSVVGLGMTASSGIFVALIVRLREIVWTAIGLLVI